MISAARSGVVFAECFSTTGAKGLYAAEWISFAESIACGASEPVEFSAAMVENSSVGLESKPKLKLVSGGASGTAASSVIGSVADSSGLKSVTVPEAENAGVPPLRCAPVGMTKEKYAALQSR
jgi:hypothetical protein